MPPVLFTAIHVAGMKVHCRYGVIEKFLPMRVFLRHVLWQIRDFSTDVLINVLLLRLDQVTAEEDTVPVQRQAEMDVGQTTEIFSFTIN